MEVYVTISIVITGAKIVRMDEVEKTSTFRKKGSETDTPVIVNYS